MLSFTTIINKIFTRGLNKNQNYNIPDDKSLRFEYLQKQIITNIFLIFGFFTTVFFATNTEKLIEIRIFEYSIAAILLISFLLRRIWNCKNEKTYYIYGNLIPAVAICVLFADLYYRGDVHGFNGCWILLVPIFSIFVLGCKNGIIMTAIMLFWILLVPFLPENNKHYSYNTAMILRTVWIYFLTTLMVFTSEHIRIRYHNHILAMYDKAKKRNHDLEKLGLLDTVTGTHNQRSFTMRAESLWRFAVQESKTLSLAAIDIDNFNDLQNTYGNYAVNEILRMATHTLANCACRPLDIISHIDGGRFAVLFFDTDIKQAAWIAKKLCADIGVHSTTLPDGSIAQISLSVGIASQTPNENSRLNDLIADADANLNKSKENGGNQIIAE